MSMKDIVDDVERELLKALTEAGLELTADNIINLASIIAKSYDNGVPIEAHEAVKKLLVVPEPVKLDVCTCGAAKVGSGVHSSWCDVA